MARERLGKLCLFLHPSTLFTQLLKPGEIFFGDRFLKEHGINITWNQWSLAFRKGLLLNWKIAYYNLHKNADL